jgi:hypothetical protein
VKLSYLAIVVSAITDLRDLGLEVIDFVFSPWVGALPGWHQKAAQNTASQ